MTTRSTSPDGPGSADDPGRRRRVVVAVLAVLVVLALAATAVLLTRGGSDDGPEDGPDGAGGGIDGVLTFDGLTREHVPDPVYTDPVPPVGGDHLAWWQDCGAYDTPVPDGAAVHAMEHGAVWVTYAPDLPEDAVAALDALAARTPYLLLTPHEDLPTPVVASAWGVQLRLDDVDDPRLPQFLAEYLQGPQTPEPGAPCSGGSAAMP